MTERSEFTKQINLAVEVLARDFGAEEIWLFGSCAAGTADGDSDIDLLVVREDRPDSPRPSVDARLSLAREGVHHSFDLLVLTPDRWRQARERPAGVYGEVVRRGKKLYERRPQPSGELVRAGAEGP